MRYDLSAVGEPLFGMTASVSPPNTIFRAAHRSGVHEGRRTALLPGALPGYTELRFRLDVDRRMTYHCGKDRLRDGRIERIAVPPCQRRRVVWAPLHPCTPLERSVRRTAVHSAHAVVRPATATADRQGVLTGARHRKQRRGDRHSKECQQQDGKKSLH